MKKRLFALLFALVMLVSLLPAAALADEAEAAEEACPFEIADGYIVGTYTAENKVIEILVNGNGAGAGWSTVTIKYPAPAGLITIEVYINGAEQIVTYTLGEETVIPGDSNGDGQLTARDALLAARYAANMIGEDALDVAAADMNGDGVVTARDALLIARAAAGAA